jgi:hypothetical protein
MALNLHAIVRPAINAVNPDQSILWRQSTGNTGQPGGRPLPGYTDVTVEGNVQAVSGDDLKHTDFISQQGVKRVVYLFGNVQAINRPDALGGDLLHFPEVRGGATKIWLVTHVLETWAPDVAGWCKVGVVLQTDQVPL